MEAIRRIAVATDLSAPSRHAAERAAQLGHDMHAGLELVHVIRHTALADLRRWLGADVDPAAVLEADARARLGQLADDLARRFGAQVAVRLRQGHPVEEVTQAAAESGADLLVAGTRGASLMRGMVIGSTAERLARCARRPVLMVRHGPRGAWRRVLVPVDFSPWSLQSVRLARAVAPAATLVLMHAVEVPLEGRMRLAGVDEAALARGRGAARAEAEHGLHALAARAGLAAGSYVIATPSGADAWMLVVGQEQEHDCDLVVLGKHGRDALDELLLGGTTRMVLAEGSADVLVSTAHDDG